MGGRQIRGALTVMAVAALLYGATLLHMPEAAPAAAERVTRTVTLPERSGVAVELDRCGTLQEARISAARLTMQGSAGFVRQDAGWRVLGALADTREEAEVICGKLAAHGVNASGRAWNIDGLTLRVTAQPQQADALEAAMHAADMAAVQPGRIAQQLDAGEIGTARARALTAILTADLLTAQNGLQTAGTAGRLSDAADRLLSGALAALQPLTADRGQTPLQLSGELRCAGMAARQEWERAVADIRALQP